jgi:hypothetical protein
MSTRWLALAVAAGMALAPAARAAEGDDTVVAQRGDVSLTVRDVRQLLEMSDPDTRRQMEHDPAALAQRLRDRLLQLTVLADAKAHQWDTRPDVAWRAEQAREGAIEESYVASLIPDDPAFPSDAQLQAAYDANKAKLILPRQYHVAQIFVAAPQSAPVQSDADALRKITDFRTQITKSHADFAAIARAHSDDKASAANGGDLGWLREDALAAPIRSAVAGLSEGAVSDPVRSAEGWHVLKLLGTRPAAPATLAEARDTLVRAMRQERAVQAQRTYLAGLLKQQPIQLNEIELGKLTGK